MGLDITAYSKLRAHESQSINHEEAWDLGLVGIYRNPDFPDHASDLEEKFYRCDGEEHEFRAGSYRWYNTWRNELAKFAGYPASPYEQYGETRMRHDATVWGGAEGPFSELIHFSDCEGCIGPAYSAKLAKDFADNQAKADQHPDEPFRRLYAHWRKAFELAANGGAVRFH
jgi:hypothetical protein